MPRTCWDRSDSSPAAQHHPHYTGNQAWSCTGVDAPESSASSLAWISSPAVTLASLSWRRGPIKRAAACFESMNNRVEWASAEDGPFRTDVDAPACGFAHYTSGHAGGSVDRTWRTSPAAAPRTCPHTHAHRPAHLGPTGMTGCDREETAIYRHSKRLDSQATSPSTEGPRHDTRQHP